MEDVILAATKVHQALTEAGEDKSCILGTKVLLEVLRSRGIQDAYPLVVKAHILNPTFAERMRKAGSTPLTEEQIRECEDAGGARVVIGHPDAPADCWRGHLVGVVPRTSGGGILVDVTIAQANRPDFAIALPPCVITGVAAKYLGGEGAFTVGRNGCQIIYRALPEDASFVDTPIWKDDRYSRAIATRASQI